MTAMKSVPNIRFALMLALLVTSVPAPSAAQTARALPHRSDLLTSCDSPAIVGTKSKRRGHGCRCYGTGGVGADVSARTAAPVVGGLWSCMFLTLLVIPAAYAMWRRHQVRSALEVSPTHHVTTASEGAV